jgi:subtilisin family serine protease
VWAVLSGAIVVAVFCVPAAASAFSQTPKEPFVKNEVLVRFSSPDQERSSRAIERSGAFLIERLGDLGWVRLRLPEGIEVADAIDRFSGIREVEAVQPNFYYSLLAEPNDPQYGHLGMYGLLKISAPLAWDLTTGSSSVVIANIDTGMRLTHEDLAANLWVNPGEIPGNGIDDDGNGFIDDVHGWDFRFDDSDPTDEHGHGTHVGGTMGAVGNNGIGIVGVNWNVSLMTIKIFNAAANDTTSAMLINAYNYVRMMKQNGVNIRVTNNSYGGCPETCNYDQATKDAIDALGDAGILNVFAAGNGGTNIEITPFYPASYNSPSILSVAASNLSDNRASFSNFGSVSVDLAAPGAGILSTTFSSDSSYGQSSGTSMAAPKVSGAAALLAAHHPELSAASLKATLMNNVDVFKQWSGLVKTGGRLNVAAALQNPTICSFSPSQSEISAPTKGGYFSIDVKSSPNCDYDVKSNVNWIYIETISPMSGNGTVSLRVRLNSAITRSGTVTIGGETVIITQSRK